MTTAPQHDPSDIPQAHTHEVPVPAASLTAPAVRPPRWSGKKTAIVAALAISFTSAGAITAAAAVPQGTGASVGGGMHGMHGMRGGPGGMGGPGMGAPGMGAPGSGGGMPGGTGGQTGQGGQSGTSGQTGSSGQTGQGGTSGQTGQSGQVAPGQGSGASDPQGAAQAPSGLQQGGTTAVPTSITLDTTTTPRSL